MEEKGLMRRLMENKKVWRNYRFGMCLFGSSALAFVAFMLVYQSIQGGAESVLQFIVFG